MHTRAHTRVNTCLGSFNSLFIHNRVNGSEIQGKVGFKAASPAQKRALILGQETGLVLVWRLEGGWSHNSAVLDRSLLGVYHSHSLLISSSVSHSVFYTMKDTHTHTHSMGQM